MKAHLNYYETLKEAHIRLNRTVVMYDDVPYFVIAITNHMKDGIFRIYLAPLAVSDLTPSNNPIPWPSVEEFHPEQNNLGAYLDKWIVDNPTSGILRKQMNSPLFNRYRPFPLGMCNYGKRTVYFERAPARPKTEQGLTMNMIQMTLVELQSEHQPGSYRLPLNPRSAELHNCIKAAHPAPEICLNNLLSGEYENRAVAFHREFAFVKGPIDMIFLAYRTDIIGVLPKNNFQYLRLGNKFQHCREACLDTGLFANVD